MTRFVLDASVAAKWFLPPAGESLVPQAVGLFRRYSAGEIEFLVPDLFWAEFGNIAWKAVQRERWKTSNALEAVSRMRSCDLFTVDSKSLLEDGLEIAVAYGRPVNDALYLALAVMSQTEMITADERLVNALGSRFPIRWLGAFSST